MGNRAVTSSSSEDQPTAVIAARQHSPDARAALALLLLRVGLVGVGAVVSWAALVQLDIVSAFPPSPLFSALVLAPVNVICLVIVRRLLHRRGLRARDLIGFRRQRLGVDLLWGLLWLGVLYMPFVATIMGVMALLHGDRMFAAFETVFFDAAAVPNLSAGAALALGIIAVVTFAPLNAPTEELVYRGFAQSMLARRIPAAAAVAVSALVFGVQHVFFAPTADAVIVYAAAFTVWGAGSGLIYLRQRRLMPLIIAHGLVNLFTSLPALAIPFFL